MKLKNAEIINAINVMTTLTNLYFPIKATYAINKNYKKLMAEYRDYEAILNAINDEYNDSEGYVIKSKEHERDIKINELLNIEVEFEFFKVPESMFVNSDVNITLQQLEILEFMVE